jgi:phosphatidylethanolamine-binding protein (PEBP) family uncharacterized protein
MNSNRPARRIPRIAFLMSACALASIAEPVPRSPFVIASSDHELGISVPEIYTAKAFGCSGGNSSPPLEWHGAPKGTKSFVLTLFDRDERSTPSGWWHWVVYDLPPTADRLPMGAGSAGNSSLPAGTHQGRSDLGEDAYHGPCPAKGDIGLPGTSARQGCAGSPLWALT